MQAVHPHTRKRQPFVFGLALLVAFVLGGCVAEHEPATTDLGSLEQHLLPSVPEPIRPIAFAKVETTRPTFRFVATDPAEGTITYRLQWTTDPTFGSGVVTRTVSGASGVEASYTVGSGEALSNGTTYYWRVRAETGAGNSAYSGARALRVDTALDEYAWHQSGAWSFGQGERIDVELEGAALTLNWQTIPYWSVDFEDGTLGGFIDSNSFNDTCYVGGENLGLCYAENSTEQAFSGSRSIKLVDQNDDGWFYLYQSDVLTGSEGRLVYRVRREDDYLGREYVAPMYISGGSLLATTAVARWGYGLNRFRYISHNGFHTDFSPNLSYDKDRWYEVMIEYRPDHRADIYVDGVLRHANERFFNRDDPTGVVFRTYTAGSYATGQSITYLDDVEAFSLATSGSYHAPPIAFADRPAETNRWGALSWSATEPVAGSTVRVQVEHWDGDAWSIVPESDLPGNGAGFASGPVSLEGLNPGAYPEIRIRGNLERASVTSTPPTLDAIDVGWVWVSEVLEFTVQPQNRQAGQTLNTVEVSVKDIDGSVLTGSESAVTLALASGPDGAILQGTTTRAPVNGVASFDDLVLTTAGTYTFLATADGASDDISAAFTISPAAPAVVVMIAGDGQSGAVGETLAEELVIEIRDTHGNPVPGASVTWAASSDGSIDGEASTGADGRAHATATLGTSMGDYVFTAQTAVGNVPFDATATSGPAWTIERVSGDAQSGTVGQVLDLPLVVRVRDEFGNTVSGAPVAWSATGDAQTSGGTTTDGDGLASATATLGTVSGGYTYTASITRPDATVQQVQFEATAAPGPAYDVDIVSGNEQSGVVATNLPDPLVVRIIDVYGNPVSGASVTWAASGDGSDVTGDGTSDASGLASATALLGTVAREYTYTASITRPDSSIATGQFNAEATPAAPSTIVKIAGDGQSGTVGSPLPTALLVEVRDTHGNPVPGITVNWTSPDGSTDPTSGDTGSNGRTSTTATLGTSAGTQTFRATVAGTGIFTDFSATANPDAPAAIVKIAGDGQTGTVGTALSTALLVEVRDSHGNPVPGVTVNWTSPHGTTNPTSGDTGSTGRTSTTATLGTTAGSQTFTATVDATAISTDFSATATPDAPDAIVKISGDAQSDTVGNALDDPLVVEVRDQHGNPVPGITVNWTSPDGTTNPTSGSTGSNGRTSTIATLGTTAGAQSFTATVEGTAIFTSFSATANPDAPSAVVRISGDGQTGTVGDALTNALIVEVRDQHGNPVPGASVSWSASGNGSVSGENTTGSDGRASATATLGTVAGGYTYSAGIGVDSTQFTATASAGAPASIVRISGDGQSGTVDTNLTDPLVIEVHDQYGNPVPSASVSWTASGNGSTSGGTTTGSDGRAATTARLGTVTGAYTFTASVTGADPIGFSATATAGAPASVTKISGDEQAGTVGTTLSSGLVIEVRDAFENVVPGATVSWTASGNGDVSGGATTNSSGRATSTATLGTVAGEYSFTATVGTVDPVSFVATANPGTAVALVKVSGDGQEATVGTTLPSALRVRADDTYGNPVPGTTVTWSALTAGASVGSPETTTDGSGRAQTTATLGTTAGTYAFRAELDDGTSVDFSATGLAAAPYRLHFSSLPQNLSAGACSNPVTLQLRDAYGNVATAVGDVTVNLLSDSATLDFHAEAPCESATRITGVIVPAGSSSATFLFRDTTVGDPTITARDQADALLEASQQHQILAEGSPTRLAFVGPALEVDAGACSPAIRVQSQDSFGNPLAPAADITITLGSDSDQTVFYRDSACDIEAPGSQITLQAGQTDVIAYFVETRSGALEVTAEADGLDPGQQSHAVLAGPLYRLSFLTPPRTMAAGSCSEVLEAQTQDFYGNRRRVSAPTPVELSVQGSDTLAFFHDASCETPVAGSTITLAPNEHLVSFHVLDTTVGEPSIVADTAEVTVAAEQTQTVIAAAPSRIAFVGPPVSAVAGACTPEPLTVQSQDAYGNASPVSSSTVIGLAGPAGVDFGFFSDADCTSSVETATITAGTHSTSFWASSEVAGIHRVDATHGVLGAADRTVTIVAEPAVALALSGLPDPFPAGDTADLVVSAVDRFGNVDPDYRGTVSFQSDDPQASLPPPSAFEESHAGSRTFPGVRLATAGERTISAADGGGVDGDLSISVVPSAAYRVALTGDAGALAGSVAQVQIQIEDAWGNAVATTHPVTLTVTGSDTVRIQSTSLSGAGPLPATSVTGDTSSSGAATAAVGDTEIGTVQICAGHDTLSGEDACHSVAFSAGSPDRIELVAPEPIATVGGTAAVDLRVVDTYGNPVALDVAVQLAVDGGATFEDGDGDTIDVTTSAATGTATVSVTGTTASTVRVTVSSATYDGSALPETSPHGEVEITFVADAPHRARVTAPAEATAGEAATIALQLVDVFGNPAEGTVEVCVAATGESGAEAEVEPECVTTDASGAATVAVTATRAETVTVTATTTALPGSGDPDDSDEFLVVPASPDHLRLTPPTEATAACADAELGVQVVDAFDNPTAGEIEIDLAVTADAGTVEIVSTTLGGAVVDGATVTGTTAADGAATVRISLDAAAIASVHWSSTELPADPADFLPAEVAFEPGPADAATSSLSATESLVQVGTGESRIRVVPRDACDLVLGAGRDVVIEASYGEVSEVAYLGDGLYEAIFTSGVCEADPAVVSARVDGVDLDTAVEIEISCLEVSPSSPVEVEIDTGEACAAGDEWLVIAVFPQDLEGNPIQQEDAVALSVDEDAPFVVQGDTWFMEVAGEGRVGFVEVGSDRCGGPYPVTVRANGSALETVVDLTFTCPALSAEATGFEASPAEVPADGQTAARVTVTAVDRCGNPAFGRDLSAQITHAALPVILDPSEAVTADSLGEGTDGTAVFELVSDRAGRTGLAVTEGGVRAESDPALVSFTLTDVLTVDYGTGVRDGVIGQRVRLTAELTNHYGAPLVDVVLMPDHQGLETLAAAGAELGADGIHIPSIPAHDTVRVTLEARITVGTGQATSRLTASYGAEEAGDERLSVDSPDVAILVGGAHYPAGCECATGAGSSGTLPILALLGGLALLRMRSRARR